jgi:peptide/nickel transport system substrate-binding protein
MVRWEQGALVEAARFDDYYRGRPPLDTIVMRFVSDPNALVANILSGTVDAVLSGASGTSINLDQAVDVKHRWEGTGNQVLTSQTDSAIWAFGQYQAEYSVPKDVMNNLQVRQALLHAIDRPALAEVLTAGLSPVADSYVPPADPRYPEMEPFIAKFPYDTARAQQLLGQAGWNRGADGVFTRASDGQRLELDFWVRGGATEKAASIIADNWNRVGIATTPYVIPAARRTDREYEVKRPGFLCCIRAGPTFEGGTEATVRAIPTAATNWQGLNYGGYVNPKADALVERLTQTLDPRARLPIAQQLVQEYTSDVALMPLWWEVFPMLMLQGVKGPRPNFVLPLANIFEWDKT